MYKVKFDTGEIVDFANQPTDQDIEDVVKKLGIKPKTSTVPQEAKPQKDLLSKATGIVGKIFPGKQVGEAIGTLAGYGISKAQGTSEFYDTSAPTPLQVGADVISGALNVAGMKGVGTVGTFGQRVLKMVGLGAGISGAEAIKEGGDIGDVAKSATFGGVVGGALPIVGAGLRAVGRQIEQLPARFVNSALNRSKQQVLQDISKDKIDDFANYVIKSKPVGSANKLVGESMNNVETLGNKVGEMLKSSSGKITRSDFLKQMTKIPEAEGALLNEKGIVEIVTKLAPQTKKLLSQESLLLADANKLRQLVDKTLGDRAFLGGQLSSDKIILKAFANNLRESVKSKAPEGTRAIFSELANEIRFRDGLLDRIAKKAGNQVLTFGDFIGGGLGGVFGGGIPGAVAGVATRRALESVPFKLGVAKLTNALTKLSPSIEQLTPALQTELLNFFADIFSEENQSKD